MNILFIAEIDWMKKPVIDMHILAEGLSLIGHKVYAVDYESMWDGNRTPNELNVSRALPYSSVHLIRPDFIRIPVLSRMSAFVSHYFVIGQVIKDFKIDAIVLYSVPTNGMQTVHWARKHKIPIIFRSIDILSELVHYAPLKKMTRIMEGKVYSKVDKVLTLTPKLSEYVKGLGARNVGVLPMSVDTSNFHSYKDDAMRDRWGLTDRDKVILSIGTLYWFSGLDLFIPQMKRIIDTIPETKLLIVGEGKQRGRLEAIVESYGLSDNVVFTGWQPYKDVPRYINTADVCIHPFVDCEATRDIFPGKVAQFLACGKPLIATPLVGVRSMIPSENSGVVYGGIGGMAEKVIALLENPELAVRIGNEGLQHVLKVHDYKVVVRKLECELELLTKWAADSSDKKIRAYTLV